MGIHFEHTMQETSLIAYDELGNKVIKRYGEILIALKELQNIDGDATDTEIMNHLLKQDPNYVRPRRNEMVNKFKMVGYSQTRKCKLTGSTCRAWKLTKKGEQAYDRQMSEMQERETAHKAFEDRTSSPALCLAMS